MEFEQEKHFRRDVGVTENSSLYKPSLLFSSKANDQINKANFYLEVVLTCCIFLSGLLTLTMEKDWWGGYLGPDKNYS